MGIRASARPGWAGTTRGRRASYSTKGGMGWDGSAGQHGTTNPAHPSVISHQPIHQPSTMPAEDCTGTPAPHRAGRYGSCHWAWVARTDGVDVLAGALCTHARSVGQSDSVHCSMPPFLRSGRITRPGRGGMAVPPERLTLGEKVSDRQSDADVSHLLQRLSAIKESDPRVCPQRGLMIGPARTRPPRSTVRRTAILSNRIAGDRPGWVGHCMEITIHHPNRPSTQLRRDVSWSRRA